MVPCRGRRALVGALVALLTACTSPAPGLREAPPSAALGAVELSEVPFFPQDDYQCGPAALATVLVRSGVEITPAALAPQVYLPGRRGSLQIELVAAARRHGRIPVAIAPTLAALVAELNGGHPVLILQNLRLATWPAWHYAVVVGHEPGREVFFLRSGRTERLETPTRELLRTWGLAGYWGIVVLRPGALPASDDPQPFLEAVAAMEGIADPGLLITTYRAALERWPTHFAARFGLANALRATGQLREAERLYRVLLAERPDEPAVVNNLADLLIDRRRPAQALALLDGALSAGDDGGKLRTVLEETRREALAARNARARSPR